MTPAIPVERRGHAERETNEEHHHEDRDEIAHVALCYQTVSAQSPMLRQAYAACLRVAEEHYENFPVASWLLPAPMRPHVAAVYAFARCADDFADEGSHSADHRLCLLDDWLTRLHDAVNGRFSIGATDDRDLVFMAVADTIRDRNLPVQLFEDLLSAFRQDVTVHRYEGWNDLLDYCRRSANPVGRLVLRIAGYQDAALDRSSDRLCSALQLTNFLQDFDIDWRRGRLYVPGDVWRTSGANESDLEGSQLSREWRAAVAEMVERTRRMFDEGRYVCDAVAGRLTLELRLTWLGGRRILDRIESSGYDPWVNRPALGLPDSVPMLWKAVRWRRLS